MSGRQLDETIVELANFPSLEHTGCRASPGPADPNRRSSGPSDRSLCVELREVEQ
jgi:hypothetical protein